MPRTQIRTLGIADNSVTTGKIANNAVTAAKTNFGNALVPVGGIIMWSGTTIPTGWALCNGSNGTPNLTNRFIVGAANVNKTGTTSQVGSSPYDPGDIGGSANATLVSHTHTVTPTTTDRNGFLSFFINILRVNRNNPGGSPFPNLPASNFDAIDGIAEGGNFGPDSSVSRGYLDSAGSSAINANLPPYYALAFIMRTS